MAMCCDDEVKNAVRAKKEDDTKLEISGRHEDNESYQQANREAKKEMSRSITQAMDKMYDKPDTERREIRMLYRRTKGRVKSTKYFTQKE